MTPAVLRIPLAIVAALLSTGCAAAMLARVDATALELSAEWKFPEGASRAAVEAALGRPETSRPLPDGSRVETYGYMLKNPEWKKLKWMSAGFTAMTVGFYEPFGVPLAAWDIHRHRRKVVFHFDETGLVIGHAPPPGYEAPDAALDRLSFREIQERCRSDHPRDPAGRDEPPRAASPW
jgi:hypothetical protein